MLLLYGLDTCCYEQFSQWLIEGIGGLNRNGQTLKTGQIQTTNKQNRKNSNGQTHRTGQIQTTNTQNRTDSNDKHTE